MVTVFTLFDCIVIFPVNEMYALLHYTNYFEIKMLLLQKNAVKQSVQKTMAMYFSYRNLTLF